MKQNRLFWALGWVTMGSLAAVQACSSDDSSGTGTGGSGGTAGSKATGGSGGKATGGSAGKATGGSAGKATGGTAGTATGGTATGGTATGGAGGAPGGAGGEGGGSGVREATCADYCDAYYGANCDSFDATNSYTSQAHCESVCDAASWPLGDPGDAAGNSVNCRLTHAGYAATMGNADTHCGHASANSTGVCVD